MTEAMRLVFSSQALFGNSSGENVGDLCELCIFTANWLNVSIKTFRASVLCPAYLSDYDSLIRDERSYDNVQTFLVSRCHKILSTTWDGYLCLYNTMIPSWCYQTSGLLITANCPCHLFLKTLNHCHLWECQFRFYSGKMFSLADFCDQDLWRVAAQRYKSPPLIDNSYRSR